MSATEGSGHAPWPKDTAQVGTVSTAELAGGLAAVERELVAQGASAKRGAWVEAFQAKA